jgi:hypothetical protein
MARIKNPVTASENYYDMTKLKRRELEFLEFGSTLKSNIN